MRIDVRTMQANLPWTTKDVAHYLGYSTRTVYDLARSGVLPATKRGRRWFFDPRAIREYAGMGADAV